MTRTIELLSIVIPCFNEEDVLPDTHKRLTTILQDLKIRKKIKDYEIVYVNNGSTDQTQKVLQSIFKNDLNVRVIWLRRNFDYQGSISAGLNYAKGDAVVSIDADLQDPPEKIEEMISLFEEGYDLVLGVRKDRSVDPWAKRIFTDLYYRLVKTLGVEVVAHHGDFRLMSQALVKEFNHLSERNRFIRAMILQLDSHYATVTYDRAARTQGISKFTPRSLFSLSLDGITSFSFVPLRLAAFLGLLMCLLTGVGIGWVIYIKITTKVIPGWTSTMLPIFALNGIQLLVLGLIGEYIGRLYLEVKQRPIFLVRQELKHDKR